MDDNIKYVMGNIYGSRVSKNGKWLNVIITTTINGQIYRVSAPVRLGAGESGKLYAERTKTPYTAVIRDLRVFEKAEQQQPPTDDLPF